MSFHMNLSSHFCQNLEDGRDQMVIISNPRDEGGSEPDKGFVSGNRDLSVRGQARERRGGGLGALST